MIRISKQTDELREAGPLECWCLHGAVGAASDWRLLSSALAKAGISTRALDLWRFLTGPLPLREFGKSLNAEAADTTFRGTGRSLVGYSMGGRLALHALLAPPHPWNAAVIISSHAGLEADHERKQRRDEDAAWARAALTENWRDFVERWNSRSLFENSVRPDSQTFGHLMQSRGEIARSFVDWSLGAQLPLWDRLPEISVPVLWVVGETDSKYRELAERAVGQLPNATLAIAPGCGHRVPWENPEWLSSQVARFLKMGTL